MPKNIYQIFLLGLTAVFLSGCATGVTAKSYVEDKPRVDQSMAEGNYGYFAGTPVPEDRSNMKDTRKIYVLEFTKEDPNQDDDSLDLPPRRPAPIVIQQPPRAQRPANPIVIPSFDEERASRSADPSYEEYVVQKNDTLQKISKKYYDSYSKWPRIHQANKDVIKNPNTIKPGITLRIPLD